MAILDHIGLNRYIYMSASVDTLTLGSHTVSEISNSSGNAILGSDLDDSRLLLGINLYNNGPYGYSSWQQMRMSENPLSRHLRKNNQFPIVGNSRERIYFSGRKRFVAEERYGTQFLLDEPSVVSNYKPIGLVGTVDDYNGSGGIIPNKFRKRISLNNNSSYFTNETINNIAGVVEKDDEVYGVLKSYYLEDAINIGDSPLSSFEKLIFRQTIYPPQQYTYKSYTRARTTFVFKWNSNIENRQQTDASNNFGGIIRSSSIWPLDVDPEWTTFPNDRSFHLGRTRWVGATSALVTTSSSFGILWNHYSQFATRLEDVGEAYKGSGNFVINNNKLKPAPLYSRRHGKTTKKSVTAPSGRRELQHSSDMDNATIFAGEAAWDVPAQSGKYPFYDSYAEASDEIRVRGKDYTVVPEYRMSEHVSDLLTSGVFSTPNNILQLTGAKPDASDSSANDFYKIYSNSDFLKNFDIILEDHKDFTDPSRITLKCKAIKKLIPYDGFYPVQRTVKLAEQFYSSYSDFIQVSTGGGIYGRDVDTDHSFQNIMGPLFAPGVLFNSIKSGVACDYPAFVGTTTMTTRITEGGYGILAPNLFDFRIPFEAIIEPEKYMADQTFLCNEPHPSGNIESTAFWDGQGDELYTKMANNFIAEVPNFFLKNEQFTTLASSPQADPNFGQIEFGIEKYTMRVKMYRSMDKPNESVVKHGGTTTRYVPPQDIIDSERKETITMYSRPSAFGPPTEGEHGFDTRVDDAISRTSPSDAVLTDSANGFNFPFTPPYYHGQAWADITFAPELQTAKKYTVAEILASSSVQYYRFDTECWTDTLTSGNGAQALSKINTNAMQLNSSINLFSKGNLGELSTGVEQNLAALNIQVDDQSGARWIIQPKFETPILNFVDYATSTGHTSDVTVSSDPLVACQTPIGMWHQYGRVPSETEGIYLQVTDIPKNWAKGRLGTPSDTLHAKTGSLAELCGFSQNPVKLGQVNNRKKISECVVAIPFVENSGVKEFFKIDPKHAEEAIAKAITADKDLLDLVDKMNRFVFPPTFDFVNFPKTVDPIAMYAFEFSSYLSQQDLTDIWQNVLPTIGREHEEASSTISHSLLGSKKLINRRKIREDIRWMVFKVKQRAASRYYDQVYKKKGSKLTDLVSEVSTDAAGPRSKVQYNWPYDFFSLVELVKIDASVEFSDVETDDEGNDQVVPKVATEENRRIQLDTLFPKGKK